MNQGKYVFSQVMEFFPRWVFEKAVRKYNGDFHSKNLNSYSHCLHLMFGQMAEWALGKYSKGGVKMHAVLDLRGSIPDSIYVTDSRWHDSNFLDAYELVIHLWVAIRSYLLLAWVKAALKSPLTITEVSKVIEASILSKADIRELLDVPAPLTQNQNVKEPTLF